MSHVCAFCQTKGYDGGEMVRLSGLRGASFAPDCVVRVVCCGSCSFYGSRVRRVACTTALCDSGLAPSMVTWCPGAAVPFRCNISGALYSAKHRDAVTEEYKNRRDPFFVSKDIFVARPWMVDSRRTTLVKLRSVLFARKKALVSGPRARFGRCVGSRWRSTIGWNVAVFDVGGDV